MFYLKKLLFGVASSTHSREYYIDRYSKVLEIVSKLGNVDYINEPLIDTTDLSSEYDVYIVFYLTGGTSKLSFELLSKVKKPVIMIASGEHNALASALSTRSKLNNIGTKNYLFIYSSENELEKLFQTLSKSLYVIESLRNIRILEINESGEVSESGLKYIEKFGGSIDAICFYDLMREGSSLYSTEVDLTMDELVRNYIIVNRDFAQKIAVLIHIVKNIIKEKNYDVVSIDCFPFILKYGYTPCLLVSYLTSIGIPVICESDYYSLPLMYIAYKLTGLSGWIANPSGYIDNYLRFAHCTVACDIGYYCRAIDHFETGKPYGLSCKYRYRDVVLARFSQDYSILRIYRGIVTESGLLSDRYCRTQALVEVPGFEPEEFYREALGNHYVFIVNKNELIKSIDIISWWMNWKLEIRN